MANSSTFDPDWRKRYAWSGDTFRKEYQNHLHAFGVLAHNYNHLESALLGLIAYYARLTRAAALVAFHGLNNKQRQEFLEQLVADREKDPIVQDLLADFVKGYGICPANRNFLMHSATDPDAIRSDVMVLKKISPQNTKRVDEVKVGLPELRAITDSVFDYEQFGLDLFFWLQARDNGGKIIYQGKEEEPPLPGKPPSPKKLTLSPPQKSGQP